jgi:hypothetical protein
MTHRERFLAVLEGRKPDRIPWVPRLDIWYNYHTRRNNMPSGYRGLGLDAIRRKLGAGHAARDGTVYKKVCEGFEIKEKFIGNELHRHLITPIGAVTEILVRDPDFPEGDYLHKEHFIKQVEDYKVMEYVEQHTHYEPDYPSYVKYDEEIGDEGLPICHTGDVPMNTIIREYIGYDNGFLELLDHEDEIESLNETMLKKISEMQQVVLESPGILFLHGLHFDTQMTSPPYFKKYLVPYFQDFCPRLKQRGKWLATHNDADSTLLLELMKEAQIPMVDCLATSPLVKCTLESVLQAWGDSIVIWGGIPSTLLCRETAGEDELEEYMNYFLSLYNQGRIIAGVSDNVMPETDIERLERVSEILSLEKSATYTHSTAFEVP